MTGRTDRYHDYWDSFYAGRASRSVPGDPSAFAQWVRGRLRPHQPVVEFGFGNARDSLWFARQGHQVTGFDFAESAVHKAQTESDASAVGAQFSVLDLYDRAAVEGAVKEVSGALDAPAVYGRFLIHSLEASGRSNLFDFAAAVLTDGGEMHLEFRTGQDRGAQHVFGEDHFRIYLDPDTVAEEIESRGGRVTHASQGHGFAVFKTEDPHVARLVAGWSV